MDALRFNVATLLKEPTGSSRRYPIEATVEALDGLALLAPLRGEVTLLRLGPQQGETGAILVLGRLTTAVLLDCSRCLTPAQVEVSFEMEDPYYPQFDVVTGHRLAGHQDDLGFDLTTDHQLDLSEAVWQHVTLAAPLQPLCSPDCAGLCPVCGQNRREQPCTHEAVDVDPRLAALQALLT